MRGDRLSRARRCAGHGQIERHHRRQNGTSDLPPSVLADRGDACASPRPLRAPIRSSATGSRTRTGELSPDRSWMDGIAGLLLRMRSAGWVPVDANPRYGEPLGGGQSVGGVRNRLGRLVSDRPPITVHLFVAHDGKKTKVSKICAQTRCACTFRGTSTRARRLQCLCVMPVTRRY